MAQKKETAVVYSQEELAPGIFSMWIVTDIADEARPGQFISVYSQDGSRLLPRPISICEADPDEGRLRIVYRIAGKGTDEFSKYVSGDPIDIMGPLGNGFPQEGENVFLIGGGIGVPPMLETGESSLNCEKQIVVQATGMKISSSRMNLRHMEKSLWRPRTAASERRAMSWTPSGRTDLTADVIYACGPTPMLRALKAVCGRRRESSAIFPWRRRWPAESVPVWPVSASQRMWTTTAMYTTSGSARMVPYFAGTRR